MHPLRLFASAAAAAAVAGLAAGCIRDRGLINPPAPIGSTIDPMFQMQERNAEASDFVIHEHEFVGATTELNDAGRDHLSKIAARVAMNDFPVLVVQSQISARDRDKYHFPVRRNEALDLERRTQVVALLAAMGVPDADSRVVISRYYGPGFQSFEAERAYFRGFGNAGGGGQGGGGGGGGFF